MNNFSNITLIDKETMINICKYGAYYNPASKHYLSSDNVVCDRCYKNHLDISIGWKSYDLCLKCTEEVNNDVNIMNNCSNITLIDKETTINICKYGAYYNPASKHYLSSNNVICDRCHKNHLDISIGWKSYDLCLKCIEEVNNELKIIDFNPNMIITNIEQDQITYKKKLNNNQFFNDNTECNKNDAIKPIFKINLN